MAAGEKTWKSAQAESKGMKKQDPLPAQEWEARVHTKKLSIEKGTESGKFYIKGLRLEALDSAMPGDTQNRSVFQMLFLGENMVDRTDQLKGLLDAIGTELEAEFLEDTDAKGNSYTYLDPRAVVDALKQFDGHIVKMVTKIDKSDPSYGPQARVKFFVKPD